MSVDHIGLAHALATQIQDAALSGPDIVTVLAMVLGVCMESQEGSHREMRPLIEGMLAAAQMAFDAVRAERTAG